MPKFLANTQTQHTNFIVGGKEQLEPKTPNKQKIKTHMRFIRDEGL